MSYTGTHIHSIDHKGRLFIPAVYRRTMGQEANGTFVVTKGYDGCLALYPLDQWMQFEERLRSLNVSRKVARNVVRHITTNAEIVPVDRQGRITVPSRLLEFAGLTKEAVVTGVLDRIEIWEPSRFENYMAESGPVFETDLETLDL